MRLVLLSIMGATAVAYGLADTEQRFPLGTRAVGVQSDFSTTANVLNASGEFVYGKSAAAQAVGVPVTMNSNTYVGTALANTANLGCGVAVAANRFTAADQYGWYQVSGVGPVVTNATFAADAAVFIVGAGQLSTTVAAGKQIIGGRSIIATAATFTKTNSVTRLNSTQLKVTNTDGLFAGLAVSGTGIAASTITDIDPGGNLVTLSAAMTANGVVTATFTYTGYGGMAYPGGALAQGQIT